MTNGLWMSALVAFMSANSRGGQETELLLEYVKRYPEKIEQFYPYLLSQFSEAVKELFIEYILKQAELSNTRKQYQNVCRILKISERVNGKEEAIKMVNTLLTKYPNRPAFRDELLKIK